MTIVFTMFVLGPSIPLMEVIKARAKCHLCLFVKRFKSPRCQRYFQRQWGANGIVGVVSDSSFIAVFNCCLNARVLSLLVVGGQEFSLLE